MHARAVIVQLVRFLKINDTMVAAVKWKHGDLVVQLMTQALVVMVQLVQSVELDTKFVAAVM